MRERGFWSCALGLLLVGSRGAGRAPRPSLRARAAHAAREAARCAPAAAAAPQRASRGASTRCGVAALRDGHDGGGLAGLPLHGLGGAARGERVGRVAGHGARLRDGGRAHVAVVLSAAISNCKRSGLRTSVRGAIGIARIDLQPPLVQIDLAAAVEHVARPGLLRRAGAVGRVREQRARALPVRLRGAVA